MHEQQDYITLTQATKITPGRPSTNCLWRWCRKGVVARDGRRVRLQHVRMGGKIFTTPQWLTEFGHEVARADAAHFEQCAAAADALQPPPHPHNETQRQKQIDQARKELAAMGV